MASCLLSVALLLQTLLPAAKASASEPPAAPIAKIEAGDGFAVALDNSGNVWAWGDNAGTFGNGSYYSSYYPTQIRTLSEIDDIAVGPDYAIAMEAGGAALWSWGENSSGQLGIGNTASTAWPVKIDLASLGIPPAKQIDAGEYYSLMLTVTGAVYAWGANGGGELGTLNESSQVWSPSPVMLDETTPLTNVKEIEAGRDFFMAVTFDGDLYVWGQNYYGEAGVGSSSVYYVTAPTLMTTIGDDVSQVYSSWEAYHGFAVTVGGAVYGWGNNNTEQLGIDSSGSDVLSPQPIPSLSSPIHMAMGENHSIAVDASNNLLATGNNDAGPLLSSVDRNTFGPLLALGDAIGVATTTDAAFALRQNAAVKVWGTNDEGQLGLGFASDSFDPPLPAQDMPTLQRRGYNVTYKFISPFGTTIACSLAQIESTEYGIMQGIANGDGSCTYYDLQAGEHELRDAEDYYHAKDPYDVIPSLTADQPLKTIEIVPEWMPTQLSFTDYDYRSGYIMGNLQSDAYPYGTEFDPSYRLFFVNGTGEPVSAIPIKTSDNNYLDLPATAVPSGAVGLRIYVDDASTPTVESYPMSGWLPLIDKPWTEPASAFADEDKDEGIAGKLAFDDTGIDTSVVKRFRIYYISVADSEMADDVSVEIESFDAGAGAKSIPMPGIEANEPIFIEYQDALGQVAFTKMLFAFDDVSLLPLPADFVPLPAASTEFSDEDYDPNELSGTIYAELNGETAVSGYRAYFLDSVGNRMKGIVQVPTDELSSDLELPANLVIPEGAVSIGVFPYDAAGKEPSATTPLTIWDAPVFLPTNVTYEDMKPEQGAVAGKISWNKPSNESVIDAYVIKSGETVIATVPASGLTSYEYVLSETSETTHMYYELYVQEGTERSEFVFSLDPYDRTSAQTNLYPETNAALPPPPAEKADLWGMGTGSTFFGGVNWYGIDEGAKGYQMYFTNDGGEKLGSVAYFKQWPFKNWYYFDGAAGVPVPAGATHIAIYSVGYDGRESANGLPLAMNSGNQDSAPQSLAFVDIDAAAGRIGGTLRWNAGADETPVTSYRIYLMDENGTRQSEPLGTVPAAASGTYRFDIPLDRSAVGTSTDLAVVAMAGETELAYSHYRFHDVTTREELLAVVKSLVKPSGSVRLADVIQYGKTGGLINLAGDPTFGREDYKLLLELIDPVTVTAIFPELQ